MSNLWEGDHVRLRAVEPEDWAAFHAFDQDTDTARKAWQISPPRSRAAARTWADEQAGQTGTDEFRLVIETVDDEQLVGTVNTFRADQHHGVFAYGITVGAEHRRRGHASEAIVILLRFMFDERRYQKCEAGVYAGNTASLALHERLGFQVEGRRRRAVFTGGRFHDEILFGITAEEFTAAHPGGTANSSPLSTPADAPTPRSTRRRAPRAEAR